MTRTTARIAAAAVGARVVSMLFVGSVGGDPLAVIRAREVKTFETRIPTTIVIDHSGVAKRWSECYR